MEFSAIAVIKILMNQDSVFFSAMFFCKKSTNQINQILAGFKTAKKKDPNFYNQALYFVDILTCQSLKIGQKYTRRYFYAMPSCLLSCHHVKYVLANLLKYSKNDMSCLSQIKTVKVLISRHTNMLTCQLSCHHANQRTHILMN
jgi:hypothetical protein